MNTNYSHIIKEAANRLPGVKHEFESLFDVLHNRHNILTRVEHVNIINWNSEVQLDSNT